MPVIGVTILPVAPGTSDPVAASIVSHLSRRYPSEVHEAYHVDHRMFVNTSSLLSNTNQKDRAFTQILTTSHQSGVTFVTTLASASAEPATVIIPTASQDPLSQLLITKFQPLWAHRQSLVAEGVRLRLPVQDTGTWHISIGDLKIAAGGGRSASVGSIGNIRGVLIEVQHSPSEHSDTQLNGETDSQYESLFGDLLRSLLCEVREYKIQDAKFHVAKIADTKSTTDQDKGTAIAKFYTTFFRSSRA